MTAPSQLIEGFRRFREQHFAEDDALYRQLVIDGQTPKTLVVACCDSRVDPALVLDCAPGDLFVIRNVANLVPPVETRYGGRHGTSAALDYAVRTLGVEHIIVLGHAHCGGIRALLMGGGGQAQESFINSWMRLAEDARTSVLRDLPDAPLEVQLEACEQRAILGSLNNLMTFDWIRERVERRTLTLHGWYFDIEHGRLLEYNQSTQSFNNL
ncbi:Carbonic anhydrase [Ferriphaselus amnicola]|uniref:Carbonic anhydrase n=1 Tax=Ferriphaselus amnicola TaxID=1188319 RepID=A0A2Z6G897_9PROT|nr:carbonic anhydrase [Ferriphaselus amnicola]BBE49629.1 Carbonic anhydrase [Ferriphaselus amnicola]